MTLNSVLRAREDELFLSVMQKRSFSCRVRNSEPWKKLVMLGSALQCAHASLSCITSFQTQTFLHLIRRSDVRSALVRSGRTRGVGHQPPRCGAHFRVGRVRQMEPLEWAVLDRQGAYETGKIEGGGPPAALSHEFSACVAILHRWMFLIWNESCVESQREGHYRYHVMKAVDV